jgi:hypothetical protein
VFYSAVVGRQSSAKAGEKTTASPDWTRESTTSVANV